MTTPHREVSPAVHRAAADVLAGFSTHAPSASELDVLNPATQERIATLPSATPHEALAQVRIAHEAGKAWARTTPNHCSQVLHDAYDLLIENQDRLAYVISTEMGKPLAEARGEVQYACDYVRWYAAELLRPAGAYRENPAGGSTILTRRAPIGLAVLIAPWNFPMAMITRKIAPAIAAGCAAVMKPATLTPLTTGIVVDLMIEAGVPEELVRVVTTRDASGFSEAVLADPRVRKLSFTGSTGVGSTLLGLAAKNIVKSSMELGGNAPLLVFDDADVERAVEGAVKAKLRNGGQSCIAANRIFVQEGIAEEFVAGFTEAMDRVVMGNPLADGVTLGPVIDERAVANMSALVDDATARGAELRTGGQVPEGEGYFFPATVLDHVPGDADIANTEIFGPVAAITRFREESQVLATANDTPFGLAGYVFTENLDRALNVADALETGLVGINNGVPSSAAAPFGGIKQSGLGREGSHEGLEEYQEIRFYNIARRPTVN